LSGVLLVPSSHSLFLAGLNTAGNCLRASRRSAQPRPSAA